MGVIIATFIGIALLQVAVLASRKFKEFYIDVLAVAYGHDFMTSSFRTGENTFHFHLFKNFVIGVRGQEARKMFFEEKSLSSSEGYRMFSKAVPTPELSATQLLFAEEEHSIHFKKQLGILLGKNRYTEIIATMLGDLQRITAAWGEEGTMDPFDHINDITFLVTLHMITSHEFVSDHAFLSRFQNHFFTQLKNNTPGMIFFPWLYRSAQRDKENSVMVLFSALSEHIETRKGSSGVSSEPIDLLLAHGMDTQGIIQFILGFLFGGVFNITKATSWILIYTSLHPQWKTSLRSEIKSMLSHLSIDTSEPLYIRLSQVPIKAWEESMPTLDLVISETLRLIMNQTVLRRNVGEALQIPGGKDDHVVSLPRGAFVVYNHADAHLNPEVYTDPWRFDPQRHTNLSSPGHQKNSYEFLGWGAGRHRCAGVKIAKLAIKTIVSLFVMNYEYDAITTRRKTHSSTVPIPDYNKVNGVSTMAFFESIDPNGKLIDLVNPGAS
ncbi:cytochrome P450 [Dendrothele bispora CBS 962.96]|uniref:Cytochrome P450 n=1 Tax=Dendrothele bispora (strain CBS 962.96) TaxID=1314807 RepID=A0A4S8L4Q3_DENBC|nr:cytochrome P450 [Dendrothele bispora CBS 962.96]